MALRPVSWDDLALMGLLNADSRVMTHILGRAATPLETQAEWLQRLERQTDVERGLGYWAGFENGCFVGWWSASHFEGRPQISGVGYRLVSVAWGRGLATEGARATVQQAFRCPDIDRVFATTMAVNARSRRVLEKIGMTHTDSWGGEESKRDLPGWDHGEVLYELPRSAWS